MYADIPIAEVEAKMGDIETQLGFELGSLFDCCGGTLCMGAKIVLVDTGDLHDVAGWKVLAEREVEAVSWRMGRGLI